MVRWAELLEEQAEKYAWLLFLSITAIYFAGTVASAALKPFWFDEYFTVELIKLPDVSTLLATLRGGADLNPPLFHLVTRAVAHMAGAGEVGARLPAVFGFWVFCASLFIFVKRSEGVACGAIAMVLPVLSGAELYAREARAYGMMLGFCGCALVFWQGLGAPSKHRPWLLAGLALSMAGAVATHLYGIFLAVPLGMGELVRSIRSRKIDWGTWLAILAGVASVGFFASFIRRGVRTDQLSEQPPSFWMIFDFYELSLRPLAIVTAFASVVLLIYARITLQRPPAAPRLRMADAAAAVAAALLVPALILSVSIPLRIYFHPRYALVGVFGLAVLAGSAAGEISRRYRGAAALLLAVLLAFFLRLEFARLLTAWRQPLEQVHLRLPAAAPRGEPVYVQEHFLYQQLAHGVNNEAVPGIVADEAISIRFRQTNGPDKNLLQLKGWSGLRIVSYPELAAGPKRFLLIYSPADFGWLLQKLREDGAEVQVTAADADLLWLAVTQSQGQPSGATR